MLEINIERRPDVNKILKMPVIQRRIKSYLSETVFQHEFSHTILHKQNVFQAKPNPALLQDNQAADRAREDQRRLDEQKKQQLEKMKMMKNPSAPTPQV
jgi:NIMA (never in mitosis gene a)-related kinase